MNLATGFASAERARLPGARAALPAACKVDLDSSLPADELGRLLWQQHQGAEDDRPLYWQRLMLIEALISNGACETDIASFEKASRGQLIFDADADYRVLLTGFDPFHLDTSIEQSNPSGVVALQLDDVQVPLGTQSAQIRTAMFPVRFADFDQGTVEARVRPLLEDGVDMIISVSMGRDHFDLERFPGRRRSSPNPDNENCAGGGNMQDPFIPAGLEQASEFVEFSLPSRVMQTASGRYQVRDNRSVTTLEQGDIQADSLESLSDQTAVQGGGGGYLSNEISFRLVRLLEGTGVPVGHIHTPRFRGHDAAALKNIVAQCRAIVEVGTKAAFQSSNAG